MKTKLFFFFFFQAEDGIRDIGVTGVQTCALPISDQRERLIAAGGGMLRFTEHSIVDAEDFESEMKRIRERGYAICDEESEIGAATVAVPIVLPEGTVRSALGTIGPRDRIVRLAEEGLVEDMERTAAVIAGLEQGTIVDALVPGL